MCLEEFTMLPYKDQLQLINKSGKLKKSQVDNDYQVTVYKIKDFYVELKRNLRELTFEKITAMRPQDLPAQYQ